MRVRRIAANLVKGDRANRDAAKQGAGRRPPEYFVRNFCQAEDTQTLRGREVPGPHG